MNAHDISELARRAYTDREQRRKLRVAQEAADQDKLANQVMMQHRDSWNSEVASVLFGHSPDAATDYLAWHALDDENDEWVLVHDGRAIEAKQKSSTTRARSRSFLFGAELGDVTLVIKVDPKNFHMHQGDLYARVESGPIQKVESMADLGGVIAHAESFVATDDGDKSAE